jgi:acetyl-CoA synthetase
MSENFDVKLDGKTYLPDPSIKENSNILDYEQRYEKFAKYPRAYWEMTADELEWFQRWDEVLEWKHPYAKWFTNAKLNITHNCLDRHVNNGKRNKVALIWLSDSGEEIIYTYRQLYREVMRFANGLKSLGVVKGDTVCIYMPQVPEQIIAMLACARIGAIHSVVYGGFGSSALRSRIIDAQAKIVITADAGIRRGKRVELKSIVDDAVVNTSSVEKIVVLRRMSPPMELYSEIEVDFHEIMEDVDPTWECEIMDSEDPLFSL